MGIPDHLTCLLRNLYAGQEVTVRTGHGPTDWFQIGKGVHQGCILSPCLFNLYAEYVTRNSGLDEAQGEIKIARSNINNLRYADVLHCWWVCKLIQPLWRTVWRFLKNLGIKLPYDPRIIIMGMCSEKTIIEIDTCTPKFTSAVFTIARM